MLSIAITASRLLSRFGTDVSPWQQESLTLESAILIPVSKIDRRSLNAGTAFPFSAEEGSLGRGALVFCATMATPVRPVVISGPSGSGKSTLLTRLFKEFPDCFSFSVSHTTRKPRPGEEHGKDYYFVPMEEFEDLIANNGFLEHAQFSGNRYGTSKQSVKEITASGRLCFLDVEINGVKSIKMANMTPRPRFIFVKPPSIEALRERLKGRGTETDESLQKRLDTAQDALDYAGQPGAYDHIIVNDDVDVAYEKLKGVLIADITELQKKKLKAGN